MSFAWPLALLGARRSSRSRCSPTCSCSGGGKKYVVRFTNLALLENVVAGLAALAPARAAGADAARARRARRRHRAARRSRGGAAAGGDRDPRRWTARAR